MGQYRDQRGDQHKQEQNTKPWSYFVCRYPVLMNSSKSEANRKIIWDMLYFKWINPVIRIFYDLEMNVMGYSPPVIPTRIVG